MVYHPSREDKTQHYGPDYYLKSVKTDSHPIAEDIVNKPARVFDGRKLRRFLSLARINCCCAQRCAGADSYQDQHSLSDRLSITDNHPDEYESGDHQEKPEGHLSARQAERPKLCFGGGPAP